METPGWFAMTLGARVLAQNDHIDAVEAWVDESASRGKPITVIQVGAAAPTLADDPAARRDPLHELCIRTPQVTAHLVEAVPWLAEALAEDLADFNARLHVHNEAISARDERRDFHFVSRRFAEDHPEQKPWKKYQVGSLTDRHLRRIIPDDYVETVTMNCLSPGSFLARAGVNADDVDVLVTDTEGFDGVIVSAFLAICRPPLIAWEDGVMPAAERQALLAELADLGYESKHVPYNMVSFNEHPSARPAPWCRPRVGCETTRQARAHVIGSTQEPVFAAQPVPGRGQQGTDRNPINAPRKRK